MHKIIVRTIGAISGAAILSGGTAVAQSPTAPKTDYGPRMMWLGGGWERKFFGPSFMLLVVIAVVLTVVFLGRRSGGSWQGSTPPPGRTPLDILKERFARGEIDKAEYEERRRVLGE